MRAGFSVPKSGICVSGLLLSGKSTAVIASGWRYWTGKEAQA